MSQQIPVAFVEQYSDNVQHLCQQMEHRFAGKTKVESQKGRTKFFEQLGATKAIRRTQRHGDTPRVDSKHRRRQVGLYDYEWSDLVDQQDEIRMLANPKSVYAQSAAMAMNRAKDEEIIAAATGTSLAVVDDSGVTQGVALPASQKVAVNYVTSGTAATSGMTLAKLIKAKDILGKNEYPQGSLLYFAISQQQLTDLLNNVEEVKNEDYAAVKALVKGEVDSFMGFQFIKTELLNIDGDDVRTCFAYVKDYLLLSVGQDVKCRITERDDKSYATQVYYSMSIGATRMQEEMVVQVDCSEG